MALKPSDQPYNIILAGPYSVGKTTIFNKLSKEVHIDYQYESVSTIARTSQQLGKWTHTALVDGNQVKVTLWDTGNLELNGIENVTRSYFRQAVGVILVYDIGNCETLDILCNWVLCVKDYFSWQWEYVTFVLWGNDRDVYLNSVTPDYLRNFITTNGLSEEMCYNINAFAGINLFESYHSLIEKIHHKLAKPMVLTSHDDSQTINSEESEQEYQNACC